MAPSDKRCLTSVSTAQVKVDCPNSPASQDEQQFKAAFWPSARLVDDFKGGKGAVSFLEPQPFALTDGRRNSTQDGRS